MDYKRVDDRLYVRLDPGEYVLEVLEDLRERLEIDNGFFQAIGAVDLVRLGHYDVETQEYAEEEFREQLEVTHFSGNIGPDKIHAHITVADRNYNAWAGHCAAARVSGTFEMIVLLSDEPVLTHRPDPTTGLDVFDL